MAKSQQRSALYLSSRQKQLKAKEPGRVTISPAFDSVELGPHGQEGEDQKEWGENRSLGSRISPQKRVLALRPPQGVEGIR